MLSGEGSARDGGTSLRPRLAGDLWTYLAGALLLVVTGLSWAVLIQQSAGMASGMSVPPVSGLAAMSDGTGVSALGPAATYLVAWGVMMAAMMLPSAAPLILLYGAVHRGMERRGQRGIPTILFALIYLTVWVIFGLPVFAVSRWIDGLAASSTTIAGFLPYGVGGLLLVAGAYQLSPLKRACLRICQTPLGFLLGQWHEGYIGTLRLALRHSVYCVGCCWALMVVLVAAGAMSLPWVLLIAMLVFAEKVLPGGEWTSRLAGLALIALGVLVGLRPDLVIVLRGQMM